MTGEAIRIEEFAFNPHTPDVAKTEEKCSDWPVVYLIHGSLSKKPCPLYIGETSNFIGRVKQHLADEEKCNLLFLPCKTFSPRCGIGVQFLKTLERE